jgi:hypothetical protein
MVACSLALNVIWKTVVWKVSLGWIWTTGGTVSIKAVAVSRFAAKTWVHATQQKRSIKRVWFTGPPFQ